MDGPDKRMEAGEEGRGRGERGLGGGRKRWRGTGCGRRSSAGISIGPRSAGGDDTRRPFAPPWTDRPPPQPCGRDQPRSPAARCARISRSRTGPARTGIPDREREIILTVSQKTSSSSPMTSQPRPGNPGCARSSAAHPMSRVGERPTVLLYTVLVHFKIHCTVYASSCRPGWGGWLPQGLP